MVRFPTIIVPVALALTIASGCVSTKSHKTEKIHDAIKDVLPSSVLAVTPKSALATQFATAWQTKLGHLPDPTKNGAMNPGIVGQVFLYTDKLSPAEIVGSLTVVANDATTRPEGMPPRQPNVWHFDAETLKRMVVNDDRFGKSLALFLPWPEDWSDVNRLLIQGRYDQPGTTPVFAMQSTVTLDLFTSGTQVNVAQSRQMASQMSVPDPKLLQQQSQANAAARGHTTTPPQFSATPASNPVTQASYQAPAATWPPIGTLPPQPPLPSSGGLPPTQQPLTGMMVPQTGGQPAEFQRTVIPRN